MTWTGTAENFYFNVISIAPAAEAAGGRTCKGRCITR